MELIGLWPANGYDFEGSLALDGEYFLGLALDEDHHPELTDGRIKAWVKQLVDEFGTVNSQSVGEHAING